MTQQNDVNNCSSTVIYVFIRKTLQKPIEKLLPERNILLDKV